MENKKTYTCKNEYTSIHSTKTQLFYLIELIFNMRLNYWKMREQKSRANWLNKENARCHRTVYITMQNVTSKLQIGLSPEMGWYPVSFTIIVKRCLDVYTRSLFMSIVQRLSWDCFFLAYTPGVLRILCSDGFPYVIAFAFSTPAFSTPAFSAPPPHSTTVQRNQPTIADLLVQLLVQFVFFGFS